MSVFFDTNILLYADDADAGAKTHIARDLLRGSLAARTGVVSTQVLQEFYVNARKKLQLDGADAGRLGNYSLVRISFAVARNRSTAKVVSCPDGPARFASKPWVAHGSSINTFGTPRTSS